ncbi:MAG: penicillin acylase family protein [Cytophagales bacterium]|nr:penicillin acylase family protein [Bernardetiaceae bacterium]MDW8204713.1 penicillin acylase family protein [Cytophagales bacterium]
MKKLKIALIALITLIVALAAGLYAWLWSTRPAMNGSLDLVALQDTVEVQFDEFGIPHIYARYETDAYYALGYVHAQERLFQMEMMRRLAAGRLSEILGAEMVETDRFFRTIGLAQAAQRSAQTHFASIDKPWKKAALAYLQGVNNFVDHGATPPEFVLLGIPKTHYTPEDFYLMHGYMAFSFAQAFRTDPLLDKLNRQLGEAYIKEFSLNFDTAVTKIPVYLPDNTTFNKTIQTATTQNTSNRFSAANESFIQIAHLVNRIEAQFPLLQGSNGWVIAPARSKSGKVILANDTHIGYAQPSVWFEAHISYPGLNFYGNYLAGFPFAVLGHSPDSGWGLTMFENDDIDFYRLKPIDSQHVEIDGKPYALQTRREVIQVKNAEPVSFEVKTSPFGVVLNDVLKPINSTLHYVSQDAPVAMWWTLHQFPTNCLEAVYILTRAKNLEQAQVGVAMLDVPGLNVMYGDATGNIAWWASGKLPQRPPSVHPEFILDGSTLQSLPQGYHPFEENPKSINPPSGFVYSANNQPEAVNNYLQPGYYLANDRADYIMAYLNNSSQWSAEEVAQMALDVKSAQAVRNIQLIASQLATETLSSDEQKALSLLQAWNGEHSLDAIAPVIYYKLLHYLHVGIFEDEVGIDDMKILIHTHFFYRSLAKIINNPESKWWDNVGTPVKETRQQIIADAFKKTIAALIEQFGTNDMAQWQWRKVHTIEHIHPIGRNRLFRSLFNVGPFPVVGGKEVINNISFIITGSGQYPATFGPAMRRIIDFANPLHSRSILPTGESGHFMSKHYCDQAEMYNTGQYRFQRMEKADIEANSIGKLMLY